MSHEIEVTPEQKAAVLRDAARRHVRPVPLADFLYERIAEDEEAGRDPFIWQFSSERWEAECTAKRRIVGLHVGSHSCPDGDTYLDTDICETLCLLALPYADHPDYREEWKP